MPVQPGLFDDISPTDILASGEHNRIRRPRRRTLRMPYVVVEQHLNGEWSAITSYPDTFEGHRIALDLLGALEHGTSFAEWRDERKSRGLPR